MENSSNLQTKGDIIINNGAKPRLFSKIPTPIIIGFGTLGLIIALVIIASSIFNNANQNGALQTIREATPTLEIYALLPEEMTAGELLETAKEIDANIEIRFYNDGSGILQIPDAEDFILFDHKLTNIQDEIIESETTEEINNELGGEEDFDEEESRFEEITYQPTDAIDNIRYSFTMGDLGYVVGYSKSDNIYTVSDLNDDFEFHTKKEALDAYLAPEVNEEVIKFEEEPTDENEQ